MKIYVINGANLNMLGIREPSIYGTDSYQTLVERVKSHAEKKGAEVVLFQSNHEGALVDKIQEAYFSGADGIVVNPGGYTHTSVAILDAVKATMLPTVEVHLSDLSERENFRQTSYIRLAAVKTITGRGIQGYLDAIDFLIEYIGGKKDARTD